MTKSTPDAPEAIPNKLVQQVQGSGRLLYDALHRCDHFDWETHMKWLYNKSPKIKALNKRLPPNRIYRISQEDSSIPGAIAYIDGYAESTIGMTPIGTTFVARVSPQHLEDITQLVRNKYVKEEDVVAMLANWAIPPDVDNHGK